MRSSTDIANNADEYSKGQQGSNSVSCKNCWRHFRSMQLTKETGFAKARLTHH